MELPLQMNVTKVGKIVRFSEIWGLVQSEKWVWQIHVHFLLTLGRTRKVIPHRGTRGGEGVDGTSPPPRWIFDMLRFFETTLPSVESLWSSLQDEVYFIGSGTAGGLWRNHWNMVANLDFIKN